MSSISTIFLTKDNEHFYKEHNDGTLVLEMSKSNITILSNDEEDLVISIDNNGSELYQNLIKLKTI